MKCCLLIVTLINISLIGITSTSICTNKKFTSEDMTSVFPKSTPVAGVNAGEYLKDESAATLPDCVLSCCKDVKCNVALMLRKSCLLVHCNASVPGGCLPKKRQGDSFNDAVMITLRNISETIGVSTPSEVSEEVSTDEEARPTDLTCIFGLSMCRKHEICYLSNNRRKQGVCACVMGFTRNEETGWCVDETATTPTTAAATVAPTIPSNNATTSAQLQVLSSTEASVTLGESTSASTVISQRPADITCIYGLQMCLEHEECTLSNSRRKQGVCSCVEGYERRTESNWCLQSNHSVSASNRTNGTTSPSISPTTVTTSPASTVIVTDKSTTTAASTKPPVVILAVSAGDNKVLQLPENSIKLSAKVSPQAEEGKEYKYEWTLEARPEGSTGSMVGKNTATLGLADLVAGFYTFKITVSSAGKYGEGHVNVTVLAVKRKNQSPVAVVKPKTQKVNLPNNAVLDGSESTDDDKIVKYHWEVVSGPLQAHDIKGDQSIIRLTKLTPGFYKFKLTVTDSDGVSNYTFANITVIEETDYPPKANAGSNVIVNLPVKELTLYGNSSTDDKGITSYEWIKSGGKLTAGMTGVRTPYLHLANLEIGDYTFTLKVKDSAGHSSTSDVHVFVRPAQNQGPKADAGEDLIVNIPEDTYFTLDGSKSTDDKKIVKYKWEKMVGLRENLLDIKNEDKSKAIVSNLKIGDYKFRLTVYDEESLQDDSVVKVTVKESVNQPPVARAGTDRKISMPAPFIVFNGSSSSDDQRIVSYEWTRTDDSLAAGDVVNESNHQAVLQITNLVAGHYQFQLTVKDEQGLSSSDTSSLVITEDPQEGNFVELQLDTNVYSFTEKHKENLINQLTLLVNKAAEGGSSIVNIQHIEQDRIQGRLIIIFHVVKKIRTDTSIMSGLEVAELIKKKKNSLTDVLDYRLLAVDTVACHNNCSGHGHCVMYTKKCSCNAFWMENFIRRYAGDQKSNCDWSILYVILICVIVAISLAGIIWMSVCCVRRCRLRKKKRPRYALLDDLDEKEALAMLPRGKRSNGTTILSHSDLSSEDEIYVKSGKTNGHIKNGLIKNGIKTKLRA